MSETTFRIAARMELRNGPLAEMLQKRGWSQHQLADYLGVHATTVSQWMRFQGRPPRRPDVLRKLMELTELPDDAIFPPTIYLRPKDERPLARSPLVLRDVPIRTLLPRAAPRLLLTASPSAEETYGVLEMQSDVQHILLDALTPRQREILTLRFGLGGDGPMSRSEVARELGISWTNVSQLEHLALLRLRTGRQAARLRVYLPDEPLPDRPTGYKHPLAIVKPFLPEPPLTPATRARQPQRRPPRSLYYTCAPPPWTPGEPQRPADQGNAVYRENPAYTKPATFHAYKDIVPGAWLGWVKVPPEWDEIEHVRRDNGELCVSMRPDTPGDHSCACGRVLLVW